jgi:DNA primase
MAIPDSFIDDLVGRTDIVGLVSDYVRLTKRSGTNMFGLCPFHNEKTPSFSVRPDRQTYYCFGCQKGGGAIHLVMERARLAFPDAVEFLAKRAGLTVPKSGVAAGSGDKRKRMLEINREAAIFFNNALSSPQGTAANAYLEKRGISKAMVKRFGLGAAPDAWTYLLEAMGAKGYGERELVEAGLAKKREGESGAYDVFRARLMFPIINERGDVVGFSGRLLGDGEPKYLNSSETDVYKKRSSMFALNIAKKTKMGMLVLVEGNIDVVSLHQAGFDCAVASLGTALTEEQARLMTRYTDTAVIVYDADEGGRGATLRAIPILVNAGMAVKVVDLGQEKDPDEFLKKLGPDAFKTLLERAENHVEYRLRMIKNKFDVATDDGRAAYVSTAAKFLAQFESKPEREIYASRVAKTAGVSKEAVIGEIGRIVQGTEKQKRGEHGSGAAHPATAPQGDARSAGRESGLSTLAEEGLVVCLSLAPELMKTVIELGFTVEEFTTPFLAKVFASITRRVAEGTQVTEALLAAGLDEAEASKLTELLQRPHSKPRGSKAVKDYIEKIRAERLKLAAPDYENLKQVREMKIRKGTGGKQ